MNPNAKPFVFNSNAPVWTPQGVVPAPPPLQTPEHPPDPPGDAAAENDDDEEIDEEVSVPSPRAV